MKYWELGAPEFTGTVPNNTPTVLVPGQSKTDKVMDTIGQVLTVAGTAYGAIQQSRAQSQTPVSTQTPYTTGTPTNTQATATSASKVPYYVGGGLLLAGIVYYVAKKKK